jgi:hypothetical protein
MTAHAAWLTPSATSTAMNAPRVPADIAIAATAAPRVKPRLNELRIWARTALALAPNSEKARAERSGLPAVWNSEIRQATRTNPAKSSTNA